MAGFVMYDISHLLDKHRKEMVELQNEQKKTQRVREQKLQELNRLAEEALRLNTQISQAEIDSMVV